VKRARVLVEPHGDVVLPQLASQNPLNPMMDQLVDALGDALGPNWDCIRMHRKPLVGAVQGYGLGGGCELAIMCDIVIATSVRAAPLSRGLRVA
jgi:hypothetical protein